MASPKIKSLMQVIRKAGLTRSELRELEEAIFQIQSEAGFKGQVTQDSPPKLPEDTEMLNRVICLLGNRMMSDLKDKGRKELTQLIGVYPTLEQAGAWKQALTKQYRELTAAEPSQKPIAASQAAEPVSPKAIAKKQAEKKQAEKTQKVKQKSKLSVQERFERFNEEADFLDRIGLGHLAVKMKLPDPED
jgi:hypothetical protein